MSLVLCNVTTSFDTVWNENLKLVHDFHAKHGHFNIPVKNMKPLYNWLNVQKQKKSKNKLRKDRLDSILSLGADLNLRDEISTSFTDEEKLLLSLCPIKIAENTSLDVRWNISFSQLYLHWLATGNTIPPKSDKTFSNWCSSQRARFKHGDIRHDRKVCLDRIGFDWTGLSDKWMAKFNALVDFKNTHGHTLVTGRCKIYPELALFVRNQRRHKLCGDISESKIALLDSIDFVWEVGDMNERYYTLKERAEIVKGKDKFSFESKLLAPKQVLLVRELTQKGFSIDDIMAEALVPSADTVKRIQSGLSYAKIS